MKKKISYIKCPRCELNYIDKKQKLCDICKAEMNLLNPNILIPDEDDEDERLCPICHESFITSEEDMCFECSKSRKEDAPDELDEDGDWQYVAEVVDEPLPVEEIGIDLTDELEDEEIEDEESEDEPVEDEDFDDEFEEDFDGLDDAVDLDSLEDDDDDDDDDDF